MIPVVCTTVYALHQDRSESNAVSQLKSEELENKFSPNVHASADSATMSFANAKLDSFNLENLQAAVPRLVQYELDKHGLLLRLSIILSLLILLVGGATVTASCVYSCVESMHRRKRIKSWEAARKGTVTPLRFTQSYGEPETDVETNISGN